MISCCIH